MSGDDVLIVRLDDGKGMRRELELRGMKLIQRSLVERAEPTESSTRFENSKEAKEQFEFLLGRYSKQGFKEVSRSNGPVAPVEPGSVASHPEYEAACLASPDDVKPWQIYADWLQERGDVRGELAALFLDGQDGEAWSRLEVERDSILGPYSERELGDFEVKHGFITGATLKCASSDSETDLRVLTETFLGKPIARFVSALKFGLADFDRANEWTEVVEVICKAVQAKQLRRLEFSEFDHQDWELPDIGYGDFSPLWSSLPALEHFKLRAGGDGGVLGRIRHPRLKTFIREADSLTSKEVAEILNANCPALERLELWTGHDAGATATSEQFAEVLAGKRFPRLTHLGVRHSELTVDLSRQLANSQLLPRLRSLDLSNGVLMDEHADFLIGLAPKFAHLELNLSANFFSERLEEVRKALPRAVLKDQRQAHERYREAGE